MYMYTIKTLNKNVIGFCSCNQFATSLFYNDYRMYKLYATISETSNIERIR